MPILDRNARINTFTFKVEIETKGQRDSRFHPHPNLPPVRGKELVQCHVFRPLPIEGEG